MQKLKLVERYCWVCEDWSFVGAWENGVCPMCDKQNHGLAFLRDRDIVSKCLSVKADS